VSVDQAKIDDTVHWLVTARSFAGPRQVLDELCERLVAAGCRLHRVAVFLRTLHPNVMGRRYQWRSDGEDAVDILEPPLSFVDTDEFRASPILALRQSGEPIRRRLIDPDCPDDFAILQNLRDDGVTDYLLQPLHFTNGELQSISWNSAAPDGFSPAELAAFEAVRQPLARAVEIYALRLTAVTLLDTYVGHGAGEQILTGRIERGDLQEIEAVILSADLEDSTGFSNSHDGSAVVARLNAFLDLLVPAIEAQGGEVLKFIGDGALAIFPLAADQNTRAHCAAALAAARATTTAAAAADCTPPLRCRIALHLGPVLYGNVGAAGRLDFTAVGPAVNLASRLDGVAKATGRAIVASASFAATVGDGFEPLGEFALQGFDTMQPVFTPAS